MYSYHLETITISTFACFILIILFNLQNYFCCINGIILYLMLCILFFAYHYLL